MYKEYVRALGAMPPDACEAFALWVEASETGRHSLIWNKKATAARMLAGYCLSWFPPLKHVLATGYVPGTQEETSEADSDITDGSDIMDGSDITEAEREVLAAWSG